ncbi:unnamed protein product [Brugia pahangi]|uniref:DUF4371 domain-containing protein n=1 Tax=Brugia pahangi TaxID=6280 RepID=A0A0N4TCM8_BRUPA|nr:unnamed protein product [Brugia pahangi]
MILSEVRASVLENLRIGGKHESFITDSALLLIQSNNMQMMEQIVPRQDDQIKLNDYEVSSTRKIMSQHKHVLLNVKHNLFVINSLKYILDELLSGYRVAARSRNCMFCTKI